MRGRHTIVLSKSDTSMSLGLALAPTLSLLTSSCTEARKRMRPLADELAAVNSPVKVMPSMAMSPEKKRRLERAGQRWRRRARGARESESRGARAMARQTCSDAMMGTAQPR